MIFPFIGKTTTNKNQLTINLAEFGLEFEETRPRVTN